MKELWLTRRNEPFTRYTLSTYDCLKLYNGDYTRIFGLKEYWGEGDTWKPVSDTMDYFYVDIETLLSEFILVDSDNDKYIKQLEELRDNNFRKQQDASISLFTNAMASIQQPENEEDREDICSLYIGESEVDPPAAER